MVSISRTLLFAWRHRAIEAPKDGLPSEGLSDCEVAVHMPCRPFLEAPAQYAVCANRRARRNGRGMASVRAAQGRQDRRITRDGQSHALATSDTVGECGVAGERGFARTARMLPCPSSRNLHVLLFVVLLHLCAATLLWIHSPQGAAATSARVAGRDAGGQTIVIHAERSLGVSQLRQGFVHGISYEKGRDYSKTIALISALRPMTWRLSSWANVYDFVVGEAKLPQTLGTVIVFNIQDLFNIRYGYDVRIRLICLPTRKNCFSSYDKFRKSWLEVVNAAIRTYAEKNLTIDYVDVFAEPDYGSGKLGITPEQLGDIFKSTHDIVRQYHPNARIVAPSLSAFRAQFLKRFLVFVAENNLRLDALSWHEFEGPIIVPSHVSEIQQFIRTQPKLCNAKCPEIHINEYEPEDQHFIPGYGVGWLYYLEKAGVDQANRACWDLPKGESTCWAGFDGLLSQDNVTPRPLYWVYKAYADMNGSRVSSETSLPQTVALASTDGSTGEIRILAGKFGQQGESGRVAIEVKGIRNDISSVIAEMTQIPNVDKGMQLLPVPRPPVRDAIRVEEGSFSIVIPKFRDGEAYSIVVRPDGGSGAP